MSAGHIATMRSERTAGQSRSPDAPDRTSRDAALQLVAPLMQPPTRGPHRRLARQFREAALRATAQEALDLDRLQRLTALGKLDVFTAQGLLTDLIRSQHERAA